MKILHVITGLNYGGAENMLDKLIETGAGTNARFQNVVLSMMTPGKIDDRIQKCGVSVHSLGMRPGVPSPNALFRLFHIIRAVQPDLILGRSDEPRVGNGCVSKCKSRVSAEK